MHITFFFTALLEYVCMLSHSVMSDSVIPWIVAHQVLLSLEFFRKEYWSVLPFPPPGHLPDPGIKPGSPALQVDSLPSELPGKPFLIIHTYLKLLLLKIDAKKKIKTKLPAG